MNLFNGNNNDRQVHWWPWLQSSTNEQSSTIDQTSTVEQTSQNIDSSTVNEDIFSPQNCLKEIIECYKTYEDCFEKQIRSFSVYKYENWLKKCSAGKDRHICEEEKQKKLKDYCEQRLTECVEKQLQNEVNDYEKNDVKTIVQILLKLKEEVFNEQSQGRDYKKKTFEDIAKNKIFQILEKNRKTNVLYSPKYCVYKILNCIEKSSQKLEKCVETCLKNEIDDYDDETIHKIIQKIRIQDFLERVEIGESLKLEECIKTCLKNEINDYDDTKIDQIIKKIQTREFLERERSDKAGILLEMLKSGRRVKLFEHDSVILRPEKQHGFERFRGDIERIMNDPTKSQQDIQGAKQQFNQHVLNLIKTVPLAAFGVVPRRKRRRRRPSQYYIELSL
jgi:hypothetical protein